MEETSLSYKTLRNSGFLFIGFVLPMIFTIFVTRMMVSHLGTAEFGVFLLVNAISAFIGYVDLGLSTAVTKYVAEYGAQGQTTALRNLLSSGRMMFMLTGLLGILVFLIIGRLLLPAFNLTSSSIPHIFMVFAFAGLTFFFNSLNFIYSAILSALQRFDLTTKLGLANMVFVSLGTIGVLQLGFSLKAVMVLNAVAAFLVLVLYSYYARKFMPEANNLGFYIETRELKKAYKFGLLSFVSNLAGSSLAYLDRLIIPIFLGPAQLAFYSVPGNVALKTVGVTNSLSGMFIPMASALGGAGDMAKLKIVYVRAFRNLSLVSAAVTLPIALFSGKILYFWLGSDYALRGTFILMILAPTYYVISLYQPLQGILVGLGRLKLLISLSLTMAVLNLLLLVIWVPAYGILGAAWAYLVSVLPMFFGFFWAEKKIFKLDNRGRDYLILYGKLAFTAIIWYGLTYFFLLPQTKNVWALVIIGPFSVLLFIILFYALRFFEPEDKTMFVQFFFQFFRIKK